MTSSVVDAVDQVIAAADAYAELEPDHPVGRPGSGATADDVERAQQARETTFPPDYVDFLRQYDGWPETPWFQRLFGTAELAGEAHEAAKETFSYSTDANPDLAPELIAATVIGDCENDSRLILLLADGAVVDFEYQELDRYPTFTDYLASRVKNLRRFRASALKRRAAVEAEWDPARRAQLEADLEALLRKTVPLKEPQNSLGQESQPATTAVPPRAAAAAKDPMPPPVAASDLRAGRRAVVQLSLELYLGAYPAPAEVLASFRAFRRHFPVPGTMIWGLPSPYYISLHNSDSADDESWAEQVRIDTSGLFGIRLAITGDRAGRKDEYVLNVTGIPPTSDGTPRSSCCEVIVPADEDPQRLAALARDLVDILPVRSGVGGYSAYIKGDNGARQDVFAWCRRYFGLHVGHINGWLEATRTRVVGASWLTVLGPAFAGVLGAPRFESPDVTVDRRADRLIITAGAAPDLGDLHRGEFPLAVAEVDRYLRPVRLAGAHQVSLQFISGQAFQLTRTELPGGFEGHRLTGAWLNRLTDPGAFLDPSPRERAEVLLKRLAKTHDGDWWRRWRKEVDDDGGYFRVLLRLLFEASYAGGTSDDSMAALELITGFDDGPLEAFNNRLANHLDRDELDLAEAYLPVALTKAPKNPTIYRNAAELADRTGDPERAREFTAAAAAAAKEGSAG